MYTSISSLFVTSAYTTSTFMYNTTIEVTLSQNLLFVLFNLILQSIKLCILEKAEIKFRRWEQENQIQASGGGSAFSSSTQEAEAGGFSVSLRPDCSTKQVQG